MAVLGKPQFYLQKKGDLLRRRRAGRAGAEQWGPFRAEWSDVSVRFDPYLGDKPIDDETALKVANRLKYKDRDVRRNPVTMDDLTAPGPLDEPPSVVLEGGEAGEPYQRRTGHSTRGMPSADEVVAPWWTRVRLTHGRALAAVFAALVVASPAVATVSGLFSQGQPNSTGPTSPGRLDGTSGQVIRESCRSRFLTCRAVRRGSPPGEDYPERDLRSARPRAERPTWLARHR